MATNDEQTKFVQSLIAEKARLEGEKQALIEEFKNSIPSEWSPDDLKEKLRTLAAKAYARISQTIDNDDEPALAFQASKYVFQYVTGAQKITDDNDPNKEFKELLENLKPPSRLQTSDDTTADETPTESLLSNNNDASSVANETASTETES